MRMEEKGAFKIAKYYNLSDMSKLILKCTLVYVFGILAIIRSNFLYIDDLGRNFTGSVKDLDTYSRYIAELLCQIFSSNRVVSDTSPLTQIVSMLVMAIVFAILVWAIAPEKMNSNWMILAAIPLGLNPYFLENISYKFECIVHSTSTLFCVLPLLLYKKRNSLYMLAISICTIFMCITYQGVTGVFPMAIIMIVALEWANGEALKRIWKLIYTSVIGYGAGLIIFKKLIMKPVATHVSSEMLELNQMIPGVIKNIISYYQIIRQDFLCIWKVLMVLVVVLFVVLYVIKSQRNKWASLGVALLTVFFLMALCYGIYPLLREPVYQPRVMRVIGVLISIICIYILANEKYISKIICFTLAWHFLTFAFTYGNCLTLQQEYSQVRTQAVLSYLNENYSDEQEYVLQITGDIGKAPAVKNKIKVYPLLDRLIPRTLDGSWSWGQYKLFRHYGLPGNFNVDTWLTTNKFDKDTLTLAKNCMWFNVYADENKILIELKN